MQKTAQRRSGKRSILNKLKEVTNVGGIAAEKLFNPEFERVMDSLRAADNRVRAIASGTTIDGEDPGNDPISLKDLLKNAKSYLNRREYMTGIAFLGRFHKKLEELNKVINALNLDVDKVHHDFLFRDLDDEQKKHLHDMKSRFAYAQPQLVASAGIMDFLINVGTQRGRALAAWEKRYPKQVGKLKKDADALYDRSDMTLRSILSSLKDMASNRASRKIDDYMKDAHKIGSFYSNYDKMFREFYNANIKGFLEKQELISPAKKVEDSADMGKQDLDVTPAPAPEVKPIPDLEVPPVAPAPVAMPPSGSDELATPRMPSNMGPAVPVSPPDTIPPVDNEKTERTNEIPPPPVSAHKKFMDSLQSMGNEKPEFLVSHILRYARSIEKNDPYVAIQLLNIAKSIKE